MQLKVIGSINYKGAHIGEWGRVCFRQLYCYQFLNYLHDTLTDLQLQNQQDDDPKIVFFGCTEPLLLAILSCIVLTCCPPPHVLWKIFSYEISRGMQNILVVILMFLLVVVWWYIYIKLHEIFEAFALRGQSLAVKTRQRYETWRG